MSDIDDDRYLPFVPSYVEGVLAPEPGEIRGLFIDVETTGLVPRSDRIIELSAVPFLFAPDGRVIAMGKAVVYREDPDRNIPEEITRLTGITNDDVKGKRIVDGVINEMVRESAIVIAHNAEFDRQFLEERLPIFERKPFGCSLSDIPWVDECHCGKLHCVMVKHLHRTYDPHRADVDCYAGVAILSTTLPKHDGKRALSYVLEAARISHARVYATGAGFDEVRNAYLKLRGYRWSPGKDGQPKAWYRDVIVGDAFVAETAWLKTVGINAPTVVQFSAKERFSNRIGVIEKERRYA
jgi:DNA polymerase-3 subunit epsilon